MATKTIIVDGKTYTVKTKGRDGGNLKAERSAKITDAVKGSSSAVITAKTLGGKVGMSTVRAAVNNWLEDNANWTKGGMVGDDGILIHKVSAKVTTK
jgi:hypothetical protein